MFCVLDVFRSCLLRHRRSHDITIVPSAKDRGGTLRPLTRSSSTTSILSCTIRKDDLPPLGTLQPRLSMSSAHSSQHGSLFRPVSVVSSLPSTPPALPARPASIAGLASIPESPVPPLSLPSANAVSAPKIPPQRSLGQHINTSSADGVTVIEIPSYTGPVDAYQLPEEPPYSEPFGSEKTTKFRPRKSQEIIDVIVAVGEDELYQREDYSYQDIYEEIRQHKDGNGKDQREEDLPDVVTSAYASGEQVYQELLDLVKEEEIKEEKRRSQLSITVQGNIIIKEAKDISPKKQNNNNASDTRHSMESVGSLEGESLASERSSSGSLGSGAEERDSLDDLYAVPRKRYNKNKKTSLSNRSDANDSGSRLPPRRVKSNYTRGPNWAPKVPEKSSLLRRTLSDAGGSKENEVVNASIGETSASNLLSNKETVTQQMQSNHSTSSNCIEIAQSNGITGRYIQIVKIAHGQNDHRDVIENDQPDTLCPVYEELHIPYDRLI
ncbi:uncharacterized protein LOC111245220 isoform X1 [Varroa destructor]|uniref:Uncharacterized protein n=1 Tax=Varroa destructor TaxID=109461 RepID=A0A7M7JA35_VARDE|nr:uncharacterized protein LOC111245220 isoform X1 [Varroa destructor]XP_022649006.1 uncharacterized protein LOC111245220 isoform X1 [Varroa destructor]XP_022649007.1 uncharacterized protein LOC111245220 isoform X1 [Varroa destructor]XP_022649008.1 uncharacterized protein LOC111245220 isoform X1 [Varroa destructor]XP_022649009.1 uncharacterized protein LOC111245220 isoform X1 [Varroa destructor]